MPSRKASADLRKRHERLERKAQAAAARAQAARRRRIRNVTLVTLAGVLMAVGLYLMLRPDPEVAGVERPSNEGREHVEASAARFDTPAPTSGPHPATAPACGSASGRLDAGLAVHGLEHGAVVVWYRPDDDERRSELRELLSEWDSHWILSENPDIDSPVVATAWNRRKAFDRSGNDLREFVSTYRKRGPEDVSCDT